MNKIRISIEMSITHLSSKLNLHVPRSFSGKFIFYGSIEYGKFAYIFFLHHLQTSQQHRLNAPNEINKLLINH